MKLGRKCTVCRHADRAKIDAALLQGEPHRKLAAQSRIGYKSLQRHKLNCLPKTLILARQAREIAHADHLVAGLVTLLKTARTYMDKSAKKEDYHTSLAGVREQTRIYALLAELEGRLSRAPQFNLLLDPEWITMRTAIVIALEPFPDARLEVVKAMEAIENTPPRLEAGA